MNISRRTFTSMIGATGLVSASSLALTVTSAFAREIKLKPGAVYKFKTSKKESENFIMFGKLRVSVGEHMKVARGYGFLKGDGVDFQITDDPRSFGLNDAQILKLKEAPIDSGISHYYCEDTPDGAAYGCIG